MYSTSGWYDDNALGPIDKQGKVVVPLLLMHKNQNKKKIDQPTTSLNKYHKTTTLTSELQEPN
jgi:hypothetical protein